MSPSWGGGALRKHQYMSRMLVAAAVLSLAAVPLAACSSTARTEVETTTTGQQLIDLKAAYDQGVISKSEYERKRKDILRK